MIKVWCHDRPVREYPDCNGWTVDSDDRLHVKRGTEAMAVYASGVWEVVEDLQTGEPDASGG